VHAQTADRFSAAQRAVQIAHARFDSVYAKLAADSIRLAQLPVFRNYEGLILRADSTFIPPAFVKRLDSAFAYADAQIRSVIGASADSILANEVAAALPEGEASKIDGRADRIGLHLRGFVHPRYATIDMRHPDDAELRGLFFSWAEDAAGLRLPAVIRHWTQPVFFLSDNRSREYRGTFTSLAINRPELWRACDAGSRTACRNALAIVPNNDTISAWFTPAEQRREVARAWRGSYAGPMYPLVRACIEDHSDPACHAVLEHTHVQSPTSAWTRRGVLRRAVERGGPGAFERLVHSNAADVATVLEATARVPIDSLVDEWRLGVLAARPPAPTPSRTEVAMSVGVGLLALGLALKRRPA
jgi:hypothetical protein